MYIYILALFVVKHSTHYTHRYWQSELLRRPQVLVPVVPENTCFVSPPRHRLHSCPLLFLCQGPQIQPSYRWAVTPNPGTFEGHRTMFPHPKALLVNLSVHSLYSCFYILYYIILSYLILYIYIHICRVSVLLQQFMSFVIIYLYYLYFIIITIMVNNKAIWM